MFSSSLLKWWITIPLIPEAISDSTYFLFLLIDHCHYFFFCFSEVSVSLMPLDAAHMDTWKNCSQNFCFYEAKMPNIGKYRIRKGLVWKNGISHPYWMTFIYLHDHCKELVHLINISSTKSIFSTWLFTHLWFTIKLCNLSTTLCLLDFLKPGLWLEWWRHNRNLVIISMSNIAKNAKYR